MLNPEQRDLVDRVQAFMAVLEGYAEHVMDAVGAGVIPDLPELRAGLERRRADRTGLLRLLEKMIGMDMKMRQYEQGKRFCDGVVELAGIDGLNRVWAGARADADAGRARRPRRLARAHRARRRRATPLDRRSERVPPGGRNRFHAAAVHCSQRSNGRSVCHKRNAALPRVHEESG